MEASIDPMLKRFFGSGPIEAGLEVGTDAGLSADEYIKIPKCCLKRVFYVESLANLNGMTVGGVFVPKEELGYVVAKVPDVVANLDAYDSDTMRFVFFGGGLFVKKLNASKEIDQLVGTDRLVSEVYCDQWTVDDIKSFLIVNDVTSAMVDNQRRPFFDACRLLSVMLGVGLTDHDKEWAIVENPPAGTVYEDSRVLDLLNMATDASTALCVRAAMFRKTKHATGGSLATGFAKKFLLQKQWPMKDNAEQKKSTTDFYKAVHASSPVAILAMIAPKDLGHFAIFSPLCGIRGAMKVHASVSLRVGGPDQVAGGSMVSDALVVLKMLKSENILPLIKNTSLLGPLGLQHKKLREAGFRAHNAYQYYSGFHPYKLAGAHVPFDQREPGCFPLVSELATIALTYYQGRTIANSPSLKTADASTEDASISALWKAISLMRKSAPRDIIMTYYGAMKGQDVAQVLAKVIEADDARFDTEKTELQNTINTALSSFDIPNFSIDLSSLTRQALIDSKENYEKIKEQILTGGE